MRRNSGAFPHSPADIPGSFSGIIAKNGRIIYDCCNFFCNSTCHNAKKML